MARIAEVEHSPFPGIHSVKTTRFQFTARERIVLVRARNIAGAAEQKLIEHLGQAEAEETDLYVRLTQIWAGIDEILESEDGVNMS